MGFILFVVLQNLAFADFSEELLDSSSQKAYQEELKKIEQREGIIFDSPLLKEYYYTLVNLGYSKGEAWTLTMKKQDELRANKDKLQNIKSINSFLYVNEQENYVNNLHQQMIETRNPDTKIRIHRMVQLAYQLTEQNRVLYKKDPVLYFIQKDYYMPQASVNQPQYYKERFERLDYHYDNLDIMYKLRIYLTNEEKEELAKEIKFYKNLRFKEKEASFIDMNYRYGNYYGKDYLTLIINDLLREELITKKDIEFINTINKYQTIKEFIKKYKIYFVTFSTLIFLVLMGLLIWRIKRK